MTPWALAGTVPVDREPWGRAVSLSAAVHAGIAAFLFMAAKAPEAILPQAVITEVTFLKEEAPVRAPSASPAAEQSNEGGRSLGTPAPAAPSNRHADLPPVPYSSAEGTPQGQVVAALPMSGPIVAPADIGLVGVRRGSLTPLAGRTDGRAAPALRGAPSGGAGASPNAPSPIALSVEDADAVGKRNLAIPLARSGPAGESGAALRALAAAPAERKKAELETLKSNPLERDRWGNGKGPFSLEGPLKYRKVLKLELPRYPRWAEEKGLEAQVAFRLWVDPKGRVKDNLYLESTSGYPELDTLAKSALLKVLFVALPNDQPQEDEWGVATFKFEFKK